jgi:hypothetical protein
LTERKNILLSLENVLQRGFSFSQEKSFESKIEERRFLTMVTRRDKKNQVILQIALKLFPSSMH